ncbi:hypothetical protein Tco_0044339 [Tanacetum coccineum]
MWRWYEGGGVLRGGSGGDVRCRWCGGRGGVVGDKVMVVVAYTGGFGDCNDDGEAGGSDDVMRVTGMVCVDGGRDDVAVGMVMMALVVEVWRGDEMVAARVVVSVGDGSGCGRRCRRRRRKLAGKRERRGRWLATIRGGCWWRCGGCDDDSGSGRPRVLATVTMVVRAGGSDDGYEVTGMVAMTVEKMVWQWDGDDG